MKVRLDPRWENKIRATPEYQAGMAQKARIVKNTVADVAPRNRGDYRRKLRVFGNSVVSGDFAGHLIEFGSRNNPAYAPMRRAALRLGLRFKDHRS